MARKDAAPTKRARLTLSQLASYDDILTDALIDHVGSALPLILVWPDTNCSALGLLLGDDPKKQK